MREDIVDTERGEVEALLRDLIEVRLPFLFTASVSLVACLPPEEQS